jgi:carbon-monoxide dehydrogenase small subunit
MTEPASLVDIAFRLNGRRVQTRVHTDEPLVETLRRLGENTTRESCGVGLCGCCAVRVDGEAISACLYWSVKANEADIVTLTGLASDPRAQKLQAAIGEAGAAQCGYCTPGMIVTALDLIGTGKRASRDEVCERMSGNLCRCACYPQLIDAIQAASGDAPAASSSSPKNHEERDSA